MLRRALLIGTVIAWLGPAAALARPTRALVILPPGEGSTITLDAYARNQASGRCADLGPHVCDQLRMYENWRFRNGALASSPSLVLGASSSESPEAGVRIVRDNFGIPHVYATGPDPQATQRRIAYGIGYAQAEERLFQMEILRHAAEGQLSELLGRPYLEMDLITRRDSETAAERRAQVSALSPSDRAALQSYVAGVNAVIQRDTAQPSLMPAGFQLLQDLPTPPWTAGDTVAIISLEVANVAESAGNGLGYAGLARRLAGHYGARHAVSILDDVQFTHDSRAPVTVPSHQRARFSSAGHAYHYIRHTRADTARLVRAIPADVFAAHRSMLTGQRAVKRATDTLGLPVFGSNAWALSPSRTTTGGALLWGAPQVSYYTPEILDELEVEGGPFHIHGVGVPGGGPGVVIGYTPHTAWSITTSQDDQVATYADRIRRHAGRYQYWWHGSWRPVQQRTETFRVRTQSPSVPLTGMLPTPTYTTSTTTFYRTLHGPRAHPLPCTVVYLDPPAGRSYCKVRDFWNQELQSGRAIVALNQATNLKQFSASVHRNLAGFNFVYADDRGHIAYWHTGRIPLWPAGADPRLPLPGGGRFDWRGYLRPSLWPSVIDPAQGYIASWNNKPQRSWDDSGDGTLWGAFQRSRQLMNMLGGRRRFTPTALWHMARRVGELDLRQTLGWRRFLTELPSHYHLSATERAAVKLVARWDGTAFYPAGAQRTHGHLTGRVRSPGFDILSAWFSNLENLVARHVFGPVLGQAHPASELQFYTRSPATSSPQFEFFDDYDAFVYNVMTGYARGAHYLGRRGPLGISRLALDQAIKQLRRTGGSQPARWHARMPMIQFQALDVSGVPSIPWENRGTWGQAITLPPAR
ncbi:MAG: penicillin acylase family protein [Solirubrobacteraceae bacterium]